jgi:hypothetical protein
MDATANCSNRRTDDTPCSSTQPPKPEQKVLRLRPDDRRAG